MESNLGDGTFKELEINLVVFMNSYGRIVYAKAFDIQREE
jgi:sensor domain CHASE-containing protein